MASNALLGFTDERIPAGVAVTALTSKIGGHAVVYGGTQISIQCQSCNSRSCALVCQIYCPVDDLNHRTLYVFACPSSSCHRASQGWRILRMQSAISSSAIKHAPKTEATSAELDWGSDGADDWGEHAADDWAEEVADGAKEKATDISNSDSVLHSMTSNDTSNGKSVELPSSGTEIIDMNDLVSSVEGLTVSHGEDMVYDAYYICVVEEGEKSSSCDQLTRQGQQLLEDYERDAEKLETMKGGANRFSSAGEQYEKSNIAHGNKMFYKFTKALSKNPSQIIRYDYGGKPLPMMSLETEIIPHCKLCGAIRTFELQLMPALVQSLATQGKHLPLDVGTVHIFSCSKNCWSGKPVLEYAVVQHDPDEHLVNKSRAAVS